VITLRHTCSHALASAQKLGLSRLDAQLLLLNVLGRPQTDRAWLLAHDGDPLNEVCNARFDDLARRRAAGEPLAYLVGSKEFFGLDLKVDGRVLIPRPDTETLVQWALDVLTPAMTKSAGRDTLRILELGTGSGAIALAVAHRLGLRSQRAQILAVDVSEGALAVARSNHGLVEDAASVEVDFVKSDWFAQVEGRFDLILSNPPYIADRDPHLADLTHEPHPALVAGADGLQDLRRITDAAPEFLNPGGWLLLEHGHDQSGAVQTLMAQNGFRGICSRPDLAGIARCTGGQTAG
jgi:release factor glutamine methyltransferase